MNATLDQMTAVLNNCGENFPFVLENEGAYQAWRSHKLRYRQELTATTVYQLNQESKLSKSKLEQVRQQVAAFNFVVFQSAGELGKPEFLVSTTPISNSRDNRCILRFRHHFGYQSGFQPNKNVL